MAGAAWPDLQNRPEIRRGTQVGFVAGQADPISSGKTQRQDSVSIRLLPGHALDFGDSGR